MIHIYNGILLCHRKGWNNAICNDTDGPRDFHTGWNKSEKDKYCILMHVCGIQKNGIDDIICKAEERHRCREQTWIPSGEGWGGMYWEIGINIYTLLCIK